MGNPVVHFEVLGKDGAKLQGFYSEMFDWQIDADNPMNYGMVSREGNTNAGGAGIGGGVGPAAPGSDGHVTFYVEVDDVDATLQKAEALGGTRVTDPMDIPEGPTIALFNDPEGHTVGLVKSM